MSVLENFVRENFLSCRQPMQQCIKLRHSLKEPVLKRRGPQTKGGETVIGVDAYSLGFANFHQQPDKYCFKVVCLLTDGSSQRQPGHSVCRLKSGSGSSPQGIVSTYVPLSALSIHQRRDEELLGASSFEAVATGSIFRHQRPHIRLHHCCCTTVAFNAWHDPERILLVHLASSSC